MYYKSVKSSRAIQLLNLKYNFKESNIFFLKYKQWQLHVNLEYNFCILNMFLGNKFIMIEIFFVAVAIKLKMKQLPDFIKTSFKSVSPNFDFRGSFIIESFLLDLCLNCCRQMRILSSVKFGNKCIFIKKLITVRINKCF